MIDTKKLREAIELNINECEFFELSLVLELLDRIDALEAENRRLREALSLCSFHLSDHDDPFHTARNAARQALNHGIKKDGG